MTNHRKTAAAVLIASAAVLSLGGCASTPVHELRFTNTASVPLAFVQQPGNEDKNMARADLQPGESVTVKIHEGEAISIADALKIEVLGD